MDLDLSKLSPAPWTYVPEDRGCSITGWLQTTGGEIGSVQTDGTNADGLFAALARNDLEVKLRRGWHTEKCIGFVDQWCVPQLIHMISPECIEAIYQKHHDVGLLTKADRWFKANFES